MGDSFSKGFPQCTSANGERKLQQWVLFSAGLPHYAYVQPNKGGIFASWERRALIGETSCLQTYVVGKSPAGVDWDHDPRVPLTGEVAQQSADCQLTLGTYWAGSSAPEAVWWPSDCWIIGTALELELVAVLSFPVKNQLIISTIKPQVVLESANDQQLTGNAKVPIQALDWFTLAHIHFKARWNPATKLFHKKT